MIIAISGKIGCGKSTLAGMLMERLPGWERVAFGDCLKEETSRIFGYPLEWNYTEEGKQKLVPIPGRMVFSGPSTARAASVRELLQWWGTEICRRIDPDFWVKRMADRLDEVAAHVIVDDVRFPSEVKMLEQEGALLVRLDPYPGWMPGPHASHESETALDGYQGWDMRLAPEHGKLAEAADEIVKRLEVIA